MLEKIFGFVLVLTRISALFLVLPVFSWRTIPVRIKAATAIILAVFISTVTPIDLDYSQVSAVEAFLLMFNEAAYGLALGLIAFFLFSVVKLSGRFIERQMGFAMANILDPLTGENSQPLSSLLEMIFIIIFLSANGHHMFLLIISRSYEAFPAGSTPTIDVLTGGVIEAGAMMFLAALRLAVPVFAAFLLLIVILGVLARIVPEMNILFISLPVRVGLGLIMVTTFLPYVNGFVSEFAELMGKLLPL